MSLTSVCAARFRAVCCTCGGDWRALSAVWGGRAPRRNWVALLAKQGHLECQWALKSHGTGHLESS